MNQWARFWMRFAGPTSTGRFSMWLASWFVSPYKARFPLAFLNRNGFRASLLGTSMPWTYIWPGIVTAALIFIGGSLYFKRMERIFVDVI